MIWHTFILVLLAEMADKTQLMMMALTNRYKTRSVVWGMIIGVTIISAFSVLAGNLIGNLIPMDWIKLCAALLFLIFGMVNLFPTKAENHTTFHLSLPILSVALTFLLAELGDKTQLATVAIAADHSDSLLPVFLGAAGGLIAANLIGILAGKLILSRLNDNVVKIFSSFIFFLFGSLRIFEVFSANPLILWIYSAILMTIAYFCYEKSRSALS